MLLESAPLGRDDVRVWTVQLDGAPELEDVLDGAERERAAGFRFARDGRRFARARAALRVVLGGCLDIPAREVVFAYGPFGKPELAGGGPQFNLSHSDGLALIAVSPSAPVGVDLERLRPVAEAADMARSFFTPEERALLSSAPPAGRDALFLGLWTRREALLKAHGKGIGDLFDRTLERDARVRELPTLPGYVAALAVGGRVPRVRVHDFRAPELTTPS